MFLDVVLKHIHFKIFIYVIFPTLTPMRLASAYIYDKKDNHPHVGLI